MKRFFHFFSLKILLLFAYIFFWNLSVIAQNSNVPVSSAKLDRPFAEAFDEAPEKYANPDGSLSTRYFAIPFCDCKVDTTEVELPDGNFERYYSIRDARKKVEIDVVAPLKNKRQVLEVYENASKMPKYGNGNDDLRKYIEKNVQFNNKGIRYVAQLSLRFIVLQNGKITGVEVDRSQNKHPEALEKDIERILTNMPAWAPAVVNTKAVHCYYNLQMMLVI